MGIVYTVLVATSGDLKRSHDLCKLNGSPGVAPGISFMVPTCLFSVSMPDLLNFTILSEKKKTLRKVTKALSPFPMLTKHWPVYLPNVLILANFLST